MIITIQYFERKANFETNFSASTEKQFFGENAADCMSQVRVFRQNHDLSKFTPAEIANVED